MGKTNTLLTTEITFLIIDNDSITAGKVESLLEKIPFLNLLGTVISPHEALKVLTEKGRVDFVFLGTGQRNAHAFDIAIMLRNQVDCIIFLGDDNEAALNAFHAGGDHFLRSTLSDGEFCEEVVALVRRKLNHGRLKISQNLLWIPTQFIHTKNLSA